MHGIGLIKIFNFRKRALALFVSVSGYVCQTKLNTQLSSPRYTLLSYRIVTNFSRVSDLLGHKITAVIMTGIKMGIPVLNHGAWGCCSHQCPLCSRDNVRAPQSGLYSQTGMR